MKETLIKKMPTQEVLEQFLKGMSGNVTVVFNKDKGEFEELTPKKI